MYFDALTTAAIHAELAQDALGGRIQKIIAPSQDALALEIHAHGRTRWLYASIHPERPRVHLSDSGFKRMVDVDSPLMLLLKKHVRDGRIINVEQTPLERILVLTVTKRISTDQDIIGQAIDCRLIIEIMGRYSNIILTDNEGSIMECAKRIFPEMNRYRTILPKQIYVPPPPQDKLSPQQSTATVVEELFRSVPANKLAWKTLVEGFRAISPLLAREVIYRAAGGNEITATTITQQSDCIDKISQTLTELFAPHDANAWQPCVALEGERVMAFAPYNITHLPLVRPCQSTSEAIAMYYQQAAASRPHQLARAHLQQALNEERGRLLRKLESLEHSLQRFASTDELRLRGEMILAYASQIQPRQDMLSVDGLEIKLDPAKTAVENAQAYFKDYAKAKAARQEVPAMIEQVKLRLAYLEATSTLVDLAEDQATITALADEVAQAGLPGSKTPNARGDAKRAKRGNPKSGKAKPSRTPGSRPVKLTVDGFQVLVGRSGRENEAVTFDMASGDDIWLHARGVPGAHVIIKTGAAEPSLETITRVAELAAGLSKGREAERVEVDYARRKRVRRIKGAPPGMVSYTDEETLSVKPKPLPNHGKP